jgi:hypothetical protein
MSGNPKPILHPDDFPNLNRKNRRALLKKLLRKQKEKTR